MTQVCTTEICVYCGKRIRFWHCWVGMKLQEVGLQSFWKTRSHYRCFHKNNDWSKP